MKKCSGRITEIPHRWNNRYFQCACLCVALVLFVAGCGSNIIVADELVRDSSPLDSETVENTDANTDTGTETDSGAPCPVLPAGTIGLADTDAAAFSFFGEGDIDWTDVEGQDFPSAWQIDTRRITHTSTGTQLYHAIPSDIAVGDHMVAEFWTRCRAAVSGQCRTGMVIERAESPWQSMASYYFETGPDWQFHQVPVVAGTPYAANMARLTFRLGYENQSIDIYPSRLVNLGALDGGSRLDCLPTTISAQSPLSFLVDAPQAATVDILYDYFVEITGLSPLSVSATGLPAWLSFNSSENRLSGVPGYRDVGTASAFTLVARSADQSTTRQFAVTVTVDPSLVGHWPLDETSGQVAVDASGNGRNGVVSGDPQWQPADGKVNGALRCDSTSLAVDYVTLPSDATMNTVQAGPHTLAAWVRMASIPAGTVESDNDFGYAILVKPGGHTGIWYDSEQRFRASYAFEGKTYGLLGPQTAQGEYHHVAATFDPDTQQYLLYVDGKVVASETLSGGDVGRDYGDEPWRIGVAAPDAATSAWGADMSVDEVRIYNKALNLHEIGSLADTWQY